MERNACHLAVERMSKESGTFEPAVVTHELLLLWAATQVPLDEKTPWLAAPGGMLLAMLSQVMPSLVHRSVHRIAVRDAV